MEWVFPCAYATLNVYDHDVIEPDHYIEQFCGNATTPPIYSSHEDLLIVFWAGHIGKGRGFVANYSFIQVQGNDNQEMPCFSTIYKFTCIVNGS